MTINLSGLDAMSRAQDLLSQSAQRLATAPPDPADMVQLLSARQQFETGVAVTHVGDEMSQKLLDVLG